MKHVNGNYSQFDHVSNTDANFIMESLGYDTAIEVDTGMTNYFRYNTSYFALSEEVVESDAGTFVKVQELPGNAVLDENSHTELTEVEFDGDTYKLEGIFESDDGIYTRMNLVAQTRKEFDLDEDEDIVITYEGKDYRIVETEEEADFLMFVSEDEEGDISVVSESDDYSDTIYLVALDEAKEEKPDFFDKKDDKKEKKDDKKKKKKGKKDDEDEEDAEEDAEEDGEEGDDKPDFLKGKKGKKDDKKEK